MTGSMHDVARPERSVAEMTNEGLPAPCEQCEPKFSLICIGPPIKF